MTDVQGILSLLQAMDRSINQCEVASLRERHSSEERIHGLEDALLSKSISLSSLAEFQRRVDDLASQRALDVDAAHNLADVARRLAQSERARVVAEEDNRVSQRAFQQVIRGLREELKAVRESYCGDVAAARERAEQEARKVLEVERKAAIEVGRELAALKEAYAVSKQGSGELRRQVSQLLAAQDQLKWTLDQQRQQSEQEKARMRLEYEQQVMRSRGGVGEGFSAEYWKAKLLAAESEHRAALQALGSRPRSPVLRHH